MEVASSWTIKMGKTMWITDIEHKASNCCCATMCHHKAGPSQLSLINLPNHACLWGNVISFCFVKPAYSRCWMNLGRVSITTLFDSGCQEKGS